MRKNNLIFAFILSFISFYSISQSKKIHFVYYKKSNFYANEKGIYADTLLLKNSYLIHKYILTKHPKDVTKTVGFIDYKLLSDEEKKIVIDIFSLSNFKYDCYYNVKKNKTSMYVTRIDNDETQNLLKKLFKETYSSYYNRIYIDHNKNEMFSTNSFFGTVYKFFPNNLVINWYDATKISGEYTFTVEKATFKDLIVVDPALEKHVTPYNTFANCEYGVQKIVSFYDTTELISVNLE